MYFSYLELRNSPKRVPSRVCTAIVPSRVCIAIVPGRVQKRDAFRNSMYPYLFFGLVEKLHLLFMNGEEHPSLDYAQDMPDRTVSVSQFKVSYIV